LHPEFRKEIEMTVRERSGAIRLPIADVNIVLVGLKSPRMAKLLIGARHQTVAKAVQVLERAKRNQIDGEVRLDSKDLGMILMAVGLSVEFLAELFDAFLEDDEQT
jgi:hypothetical protein